MMVIFLGISSHYLKFIEQHKVILRNKQQFTALLLSFAMATVTSYISL
jgi:hypothetical protein